MAHQSKGAHLTSRTLIDVSNCGSGSLLEVSMEWLFPIRIGQTLAMSVEGFKPQSATGTYQSILRIRLESRAWSCLLVTMKLLKVAPNDFSRIEDQSGFSNRT